MELGKKFMFDNPMYGDLHGKVGEVVEIFTYKNPTPQRTHELRIDFGQGPRDFTFPNNYLVEVKE